MNKEEEEQRKIKTHEDLVIYQKAFNAAMTIFELSKQFPTEERYSLTDQVRRSSRSVCANFAEAWRKRRYQASFIAKLNDCESTSGRNPSMAEICSEMSIYFYRTRTRFI